MWKYQYETFNGLPVYYGGDMYDSEDSEEYDPLEMARAACVEDYDFNVPEGMELMTYTRCRPDGGEARIVGGVDMVPMCRNVSCVTRSEPDVSSDTSGTEPSAVIEGSDIEDFCLWPDLLNEEDCSISNVGSSVDNSLCMSEQDSLSYVDVASIGDFDSEDSDEDIDIFWRTVFRWVARMSYWPTFIEDDCSRLFRSLGRMCVLDVQTDVPTGSPGDVPQRSLLPSPMSPGDGELLSSLLVPLMGKSSRRSGLTEMEHSPGMVWTTAVNFPQMDATPGGRCAIDLDMTLVTEFPWTDATPGEKYVFGLDSRTVPNFPRLDATPGDRDVIGREVMTVPILPRTSATPGEMCTMDVGFRPDVNIPPDEFKPRVRKAREN